MDNETQIYNHLLTIERKMYNIPDMIDPKIDKQLWELMSSCNSIILELVDNDLLSQQSLIILSNEYKELMKYIEVITEPSKFLLINLYFVIMMEYVVEYCEDNELFEACANVKKFENLV